MKIIIKWTSYEFNHEDTKNETDKANLNCTKDIKKKSSSDGKCLRIEMHENTDRYCCYYKIQHAILALQEAVKINKILINK